MKKTKIIIPALGILLLSTAASVTGTVAWFSMNEKVSATTMSIKGKGEAGLAIAAYTGENQGTAPAASSFSDTAVATAQSLDKMIPTWTNDAAKWYHAKSVNSNTYNASALYGYEDVSGRDDIYLLNKFQIKATGEVQDVYVKSINVSNLNSTAINSCIRVLVKTNEYTRVFAPVGNSTATETLKANLYEAIEDDPATTDVDESRPDDAVTTAMGDQSVTLVATSTASAQIFDDLGSTPKDVLIYMYFDGEDPNCTSDLIPAEWVANSISVDFTNEI